MSNLQDGIACTLVCTADLEDRKRAEQVVHFFLNLPHPLRPRWFGRFPDELHRVETSRDLVETLVGAATRESDARTGWLAGSLYLKAGPYCHFNLNWSKSDGQNKPGPFLPSVMCTLMRPLVERRATALPLFLSAIKSIVPLVEPIYGEIRSMAFDCWETPMDLTKRLPDIPNVSIYGPPYVMLFGHDCVERAPFLRVQELQPGYFWLEATECPFDEVPQELRTRVREHFGEDAFMRGKKWRYDSGRAPLIDLSRFRL